MSVLNLNTIELVSTLRPVALKGAPSTEDYNDSQEEFLLDLTTVATFINNVLIPIFKSLPANAISGLEGRAVYGDLTDQTSLFYNSVAGEPLTVADSLRQIFSVVSSLKNSVNSNTIQVGQLQQKLSSTNQNDFALAIQNLNSSINSLNARQLTIDASVSEVQTKQNNSVSVRLPVTLAPGTTTNEVVTWATAFPDNNYTVTAALNTASLNVNLIGYSYLPNGAGISVNILSSDTTDTVVILNIIAQHD